MTNRTHYILKMTGDLSQVVSLPALATQIYQLAVSHHDPKNITDAAEALK